MLSIHLYRHKEFQIDLQHDNRRVILDGKNQQLSDSGQQHRVHRANASAHEEVIVIPLEDVTRISYESEFSKSIQAHENSHKEHEYASSENCCDRCCAPMLGCCRQTRDCCHKCREDQTKVVPFVMNTTIIDSTNQNRTTKHIEIDDPVLEVKEGWCARFGHRFRCWCCRKKKLVKSTNKTDISHEEQAQRDITMTIEYSKYSYLDSASNTRLLSNQDQMAYYKEKFAPDTILKFYLDNNTEFHNENFEKRKKQAETLCRAVTQLKGMRPYYPTEYELEKILDQSHKRLFCSAYEEPALQYPSNSMIPGLNISPYPQLPQPSRPTSKQSPPPSQPLPKQPLQILWSTPEQPPPPSQPLSKQPLQISWLTLEQPPPPTSILQQGTALSLYCENRPDITSSQTNRPIILIRIPAGTNRHIYICDSPHFGNQSIRQ